MVAGGASLAPEIYKMLQKDFALVREARTKDFVTGKKHKAGEHDAQGHRDSWNIRTGIRLSLRYVKLLLNKEEL